MRTLITTAKMTQLKMNTVSMGIRKAPKNTAVSPMKQLVEKQALNKGYVLIELPGTAIAV